MSAFEAIEETEPGLPGVFPASVLVSSVYANYYPEKLLIDFPGSSFFFLDKLQINGRLLDSGHIL